MLKGLEYMHSCNIVHRDLKSANVMLAIDGSVKLSKLSLSPRSAVVFCYVSLIPVVDFGLCLDIKEQGEVISMVGSPYWIPPEMVLQQPHSYSVPKPQALIYNKGRK